jgi:hypothetical protein
MGIFSSKTKTTNFEEMLTPEQKQAMQLLTGFGSTGQLGDFQAGQGYDLSGFQTGLNASEIAGGDLLATSLGSGTPESLTTAQKTLTDIANRQFNPDDPSNEFAAFNRQLTKQTQGASDVLNREAAITGGRFGTGIQKQKQELASNQSDIAGSKLAELYSQLQQNKLSAASGLTGLAGMQENINQGRVQAAFQYGQQQREVQNQKAQMAYDDWQRARAERMTSISGLTDVMNKNVEWGLKSISKKEPGIGMKMWGTFNPLVGEYNAQQYGHTSGQARISDLMKMATTMGTGGMGGGGAAPTV